MNSGITAKNGLRPKRLNVKKKNLIIKNKPFLFDPRISDKDSIIIAVIRPSFKKLEKKIIENGQIKDETINALELIGSLICFNLEMKIYEAIIGAVD